MFAMSTNALCIFFLLVLLPSLSDATARRFPYSAPSTAISVGTDNTGGGEFVTMNPGNGFLNHRRGAPFGRAVRNCMPKGTRHSSAPSRFVNYQPLVVSPCIISSKRSKKP